MKKSTRHFICLVIASLFIHTAGVSSSVAMVPPDIEAAHGLNGMGRISNRGVQTAAITLFFVGTIAAESVAIWLANSEYPTVGALYDLLFQVKCAEEDLLCLTVLNPDLVNLTVLSPLSGVESGKNMLIGWSSVCITGNLLAVGSVLGKEPGVIPFAAVPSLIGGLLGIIFPSVDHSDLQAVKSKVKNFLDSGKLGNTTTLLQAGYDAFPHAQENQYKALISSVVGGATTLTGIVLLLFEFNGNF